MNSLRKLHILSELPARAGRPLNILAHDLKALTLSAWDTRFWSSFVGASTTHVQVGGFDLELSEIVKFLHAAPNLSALTIGTLSRPTNIYDDLDPEALAEAAESRTAICHELKRLHALEILPHGLDLLRSVLAVERIWTVGIQRSVDDPPLEWIEFLVEPTPCTVDKLSATGTGGSLVELHIASRIRRAQCAAIPGYCVIACVFDAHPSIPAILRSLVLDITQWAEFIESGLQPRVIGNLPVLKTLEITIDEGATKRTSWDWELSDDHGFAAPALRTVVLGAYGVDSPSISLVRLALVAMTAVVRDSVDTVEFRVRRGVFRGDVLD